MLSTDPYPFDPVWPFGDLEAEHYGAILADPPWAWLNWSGRHTIASRLPEDIYQTLTLNQLCALPVHMLAARDCVLFLWVIDSNLHQAMAVGEAWGFEYKTRAFEWFKTSRHDPTGPYPIGMGKWTRKQCESCLLFTRGKPRRLSGGVKQVIEAPRREHSQKPDETYERIEALVAGPYAELFAVRPWAGWHGWGDQYKRREL